MFIVVFEYFVKQAVNAQVYQYTKDKTNAYKDDIIDD
jgi:hypothetical protein